MSIVSRSAKFSSAWCTILIVLLTLTESNASSANEALQLRIGTGQSVGVYRAAGDAICRLLAKFEPNSDINCRAKFTTGSFDNIQLLRSNQLEMAIVQADIQHQAVSSNPDDLIRVRFDDLRHVVSLMDEPLKMLVTRSSRISEITDLKRKTLYLGESGAGTSLLTTLLRDLGKIPEDFEPIVALHTRQLADALCQGRIDAAAFVSSEPNILVRDATNRCDIDIVPASGELTKEFVRRQPFYSKTVIPGGSYRGIPDDVRTIGVRATLVTRADLPDAVIGAVTRALYRGVAEFRRLHLAFTNMTPEKLAASCNSAPLHRATAAFLDANGIASGEC